MVKCLTESPIKDVLDTINDIKDVAASDHSSVVRRRSPNSVNTTSISRASKDLVMSFPVLCDDSLEPTTASMICKAIERKCVTMLQLLFASCAFEGQNGKDIIGQWHNNIDDGRITIDDYLDLCDQFGESVTSADGRLINEAVKTMMNEIKHPHRYPVSSFSESSINDYKVTTRYGDTVVMEAPIMNTRDVTIMSNVSNIAKNDTEFIQKQLLDTDVKKCNELVPSLMIVKFRSNTPNGSVVDNQFVAGVKARLIPMDTYEIVERINSKNSDNQGLVNFVRATTGEIGFAKDYLFAIDKAKIDAKNNSIKNRKNSQIWKTLEKRSTKSVWKRLIGKTNSAACITSLVISERALNVLRKEYGINLADVRTAAAIMDAYNLLALVIVDESTEVARFLFDGDPMYESLSFNTLERESGDGSYKKVINLLSKMNGR